MFKRNLLACSDHLKSTKRLLISQRHQGTDGAAVSAAGSSLWREHICWCINEMSALRPRETIFKGLYSFNKNNPQTGFI
jgi:hypothetical protein